MCIYMSVAAKQAAAGGRLKATAGAACQLLSLGKAASDAEGPKQ